MLGKDYLLMTETGSWWAYLFFAIGSKEEEMEQDRMAVGATTDTVH